MKINQQYMSQDFEGFPEQLITQIPQSVDKERESATRWAKKILKKDQEPRLLVDQIYKMGYEANEKLTNGTYPQTDQLDIAQKLFTRAMEQFNHLSEQLKLETAKFIELNGFPSLSKYDPVVIETCWIVAQHADTDISFQEYVLGKMLETKQTKKTDEKKEPVTIVYFYYLTDRKCKNKFGYQIFGTQNNGQNLINLPGILFNKLQTHTAETCLELALENINEKEFTINKQQQIILWNLAQKEADSTFGTNPQYQDSIIPEFIDKFSS